MYRNRNRNVSEICLAVYPTNNASDNKSVFSYTHGHFQHSPAARSSRSMSPARRAHSSKPAAVGLLLWVGPWEDAGTDGRTPFHFIPCSAYYAGSAKNRFTGFSVPSRRPSISVVVCPAHIAQFVCDFCL